MATIGIFGRRNVGKSSLINALTEQQLAIVSDTAGTTTDPVKKSIELLGIGKSVIVDTAGFDDDTELGKQRVKKTQEIVQQIDLAILVFCENTFDVYEKEWLKSLQTLNIPFIIVHNKSDVMPLNSQLKTELETSLSTVVVEVSAMQNNGLSQVFDAIKNVLHHAQGGTPSPRNPLLTGLTEKNDIIILVTPIDSEAPAGRLILPQIQAIRAILDENAIAIECQVEQLSHTLHSLKSAPNLVITDSQAFAEVEKIVPKTCRLTSFSILLARQKGEFDAYLRGTPHINNLKNGDKILILESCTHQHSCEDIGRVKLPNLLRKRVSQTSPEAQLHIEFISGLSPLPSDWDTYAMVFQCGACMITPKQLQNRLKPFIDKGIPITNYGMALAFLSGIFERATAV